MWNAVKCSITLHCVQYTRIRVLPESHLQHRIYDFIFIQENIGQRKPVFLYIFTLFNVRRKKILHSDIMRIVNFMQLLDKTEKRKLNSLDNVWCNALKNTVKNDVTFPTCFYSLPESAIMDFGRHMFFVFIRSFYWDF